MLRRIFLAELSASNFIERGNSKRGWNFLKGISRGGGALSVGRNIIGGGFRKEEVYIFDSSVKTYFQLKKTFFYLTFSRATNRFLFQLNKKKSFLK